VTQELVGPLGVGSPSREGDRVAGQRALGALMALSPNALFPHVHQALTQLLDRWVWQRGVNE
jgi:hypothetical protein